MFFKKFRSCVSLNYYSNLFYNMTRKGHIACFFCNEIEKKVEFATTKRTKG